MKLYTALDVSLRSVAISVIDERGEGRHESKVEAEVDRIVARLRSVSSELKIVGFEAGTLTQYLTYGLGPKSEWMSIQAPVNVILFEGWCIGARPEPEVALEKPVNTLERDEDPHGIWRCHVNDVLAGIYQNLFRQIGFLILLAVPDFEIVYAGAWSRRTIFDVTWPL